MAAVTVGMYIARNESRHYDYERIHNELRAKATLNAGRIDVLHEASNARALKDVERDLKLQFVTEQIQQANGKLDQLLDQRVTRRPRE